jgi:hypothetical protein
MCSHWAEGYLCLIFGRFDCILLFPAICLHKYALSDCRLRIPNVYSSMHVGPISSCHLRTGRIGSTHWPLRPACLVIHCLNDTKQSYAARTGDHSQVHLRGKIMQTGTWACGLLWETWAGGLRTSGGDFVSHAKRPHIILLPLHVHARLMIPMGLSANCPRAQGLLSRTSSGHYPCQWMGG